MSLDCVLKGSLVETVIEAIVVTCRGFIFDYQENFCIIRDCVVVFIRSVVYRNRLFNNDLLFQALVETD